MLRRTRRGFTLIEALVNVVIVVMVSMAIMSMAVGVLRYTQFSKMRTIALPLANERMEELRNLPYDSLATVQGAIYPPGDILDEQVVTQSGVKYTLKTRIDFVDDPFDGDATGSIQGKPVDLYPYDYKKISITVWRAGWQKPVGNLVTNVSARAAETESGTGILLVTVLDAQGLPVSNATITVQNFEIAPGVNIITTTDVSGKVQIPRLPPEEHNKYHVTATKAGYSTDSTYPRTAQNPNALKPDLNIFVQQVTTETFSIDKISTMIILARDQNEASVADFPIMITSDKLIYNNPDTPKFLQTHNTNPDGQIVLQNMEWDSYALALANNQYALCSTSPQQKVSVAPDSTVTVTLHVNSDRNSPVITALTPVSGSVNGQLVLALEGDNFAQNAAVLLRKSGQPDIGAMVIDVQANGKEMTATFELTNAPPGTWDFLITNPNSNFCLQPAAVSLQ
jgi:type II secretory pathway pseudopilin PulG